MQSARAGPPSQPGRSLSRQLCRLGQYLMHPIPQSLLPGIYLPGRRRKCARFHAHGGSVGLVVAGIAHQGHQLLQLRQFQAHHTTVQGHLAQVGFGSVPSWPSSARSAPVLRRDTEVQLHSSCAWGAHRSGLFLIGRGFFSGFSAGCGSCLAGVGQNGEVGAPLNGPRCRW